MSGSFEFLRFTDIRLLPINWPIVTQSDPWIACNLWNKMYIQWNDEATCICQNIAYQGGVQKLLVTYIVKGHCYEHRFKNLRVQKQILQQRKPTVYKYSAGSSFTENYSASAMKLKKSSIIVISPGAQDPNLKKSAWSFHVRPLLRCPFKGTPSTQINHF